MKNNNCLKYEKLIYLYRDEELTEREKRSLEKHTAECALCRELLAEVTGLDHIAQTLKTVHSQTPDDLTRSIMNAVFARKIQKNQSRSLAEMFIEFWARPKTGFAVVLMAVLMTGSFFIQESIFMLKISSLETNISQNTQMTMEMYTKMEMNQLAGKFTASIEPHEWDNLSLGAGSTRIESKAFELLLAQYKETKAQNEMLKQILLKERPELLQLLKQTQDLKQLEKLLNQSKLSLQKQNEL